MIYKMREKFFAIGDDFIIQDNAGNNVFVVDGKVLTLGDKLIFRDMARNELAVIKQKLLAWGPTYEIWRGGEVQAIVKKALFTLFRQRFYVDVEGPDDLVAQGNFLDNEYTFTRCDQVVATVSKRWFTLRDTFGIEVAPGEDDILILASAVVIDLVRADVHKQNEDNT